MLKDVELKPMVYSVERSKYAEVLGSGDIDGYLWSIVSLGIHPCAYVGIPSGHPWYRVPYLKIPPLGDFCNGGLTYADSELGHTKADDVWWIGWDYAHSWDYNPVYGHVYDARMWSTELIFYHVRNVIEQAKKVR